MTSTPSALTTDKCWPRKNSKSSKNPLWLLDKHSNQGPLPVDLCIVKAAVRSPVMGLWRCRHQAARDLLPRFSSTDESHGFKREGPARQRQPADEWDHVSTKVYQGRIAEIHSPSVLSAQHEHAQTRSFSRGAQIQPKHLEAAWDPTKYRRNANTQNQGPWWSGQELEIF